MRLVGIRSRLFLATAFSIIAAAALAADINQPVTLDISSTDLTTALNQLAQQSDQQLLFSSDATRGKHSQPLHGTYAPIAALKILLHGSGLTYTLSGNTITVAAAEKEQHVENVEPLPTKRAEVLSGNGQPVQNESASEPQSLPETVVVTGTSIPGEKPVGSPLQVYTAEDISKSGAFSVQQFMATVTDNFSGGSSETLQYGTPNNVASSNNYGAGSGINLRGLGSGSTLVLLDGNRVAPSSGLADFVDVSMFPVSAIERIEVLTDGASSIYGGDAVAGVVNIVLRHDYDGAATSVRYGDSTDGGAGEFDFNQLFGTDWGTGSALLTYDFDHRENLNAADRPFSAGAVQPDDLLPSQTRHSVVGSANQALSSSVNLSIEGLYSQRDSQGSTAVSIADNNVYDAINREYDLNGSMHADLPYSFTLDGSVGYSEATTKQDNFAFDGTTNEYIYNSDSQMWTGDVKTSGSLFDIPGGPIKLAAGFHYQQEIFTNSNNSGSSAAVSRKVYAGYGELMFPIIGEDNNVPFIKRLQLDVSGRLDSYSDFGTTTNPKVGMLWAPTDNVTFHASYSTSFDPPVLGYVAGVNSLNGFPITNNVANSIFGFSDAVPNSSVAIFEFGTGPHLSPETSNTVTAGVDYKDDTPLGDLKASLTYYDVDFSDQIGQASYPGGIYNILNLYLTNPASVPQGAVVANPSCAQVTALVSKLQSQGGFNDYFGVYQGPCNVAFLVSNLTQNLSRTVNRGLSFNAALKDDAFGGTLKFTINGTYIFDYDQQAAAGLPLVNQVNTIFNPLRFKARASAGWDGGPWSATAFVNYANSYQDTNVVPFQPIGSWTTVDLNVGYDLSAQNDVLKNVNLNLNITNIFDALPPSVASFPSYNVFGFDPTNASPIGRFISLSLTKRW